MTVPPATTVSRVRRPWLLLGTVGLMVVAGALAATQLLDDEDTEAPVDAASESRPPARADPPSTIVTVRRRGGVPQAWAGRVSAVPGVTAVARTGRTQILLRQARDRSGAIVDAAPSGHAFLLDVLVIRPRSYARVLPAAVRPAVRGLRPGTALLSRTSARLRGVGAGGRLTLFDGRTLGVAGIVDDQLVRTAEVVVSARDAGAAEARAAQLVVATTQPHRIAAALPTTRPVRIRRFMGNAGRSRGGIARPAELKDRFGEFAVRLPLGEDWVGIDPGWLRRNIVTRSVPILGQVTCNRRFIAPLRRALSDIADRGLSRLVDRGDYAGCYAPRRIPGSGSLSLHAWGLAIDLNAARNPQFAASRHDPRLVRAMERVGFTWGGRWPTAPDPMHFELQAYGRR